MGAPSGRRIRRRPGSRPPSRVRCTLQTERGVDVYDLLRNRDRVLRSLGGSTCASSFVGAPPGHPELFALLRFDEVHLEPGGRDFAPPSGALVVASYVREGALVFEDAAGESELSTFAEVRVRSLGKKHHEPDSNASESLPAQVFELAFRSKNASEPGPARRKCFGSADRRDGLLVVASADGREGSLPLNVDASIYSALLEDGQHVVHALEKGRAAWLHVIAGEVATSGLILEGGDGVGAEGELSLSFTAKGRAEVLLVDLAAIRSDGPVVARLAGMVLPVPPPRGLSSG